MTGFAGQGLSLEQAPPLSIPMSFFLVAPAAAILSGILLATEGGSVLVIGWTPATIALTHLGTLGFLASVMLGALFQMAPVLGGYPVGRVRSAHAVQVGLVLGVAALVSGLLWDTPEFVFFAIAVLFSTLSFFLVLLGLALRRAVVKNDTVKGMVVALWFLGAGAGMGVWMAHGFAGMSFPGPRSTWVQVHLTLGLLGWVGGLLMAISWQLVPMFYLTPGFGAGQRKWSRRVLVSSLVATALVPLLEGFQILDASFSTRTAIIAASPAGLVVWVVHPILVIRQLSTRRRKRVDPSKNFWLFGMSVAPVVACLAVLAHASPDPRWAMAFGWLAVWGWAGIVAHGMLTRIAPFLVWFHRFSPLVGREPVPTLQKILPAAIARRSLWVHAVTAVVGIVAIWTTQDIFARATGILLGLTGLHLGYVLIRVLRFVPSSQRATPGT